MRHSSRVVRSVALSVASATFIVTGTAVASSAQAATPSSVAPSRVGVSGRHPQVGHPQVGDRTGGAAAGRGTPVVPPSGVWSRVPRAVGRLTASDAAAAAEWIRSAQLPDGAIATFPDQEHLRPNVGNQAAQGLADYARRTGDSDALDAAWAQLRWYASHEDADGVVTDYDLDADGNMVSTGDLDSTSGYAGTFLAAVESAYHATPVRQRAARLAEIEPGIDGALRAIAAVTRPDGLTWTKPSWKVVYLMRQAETYAGLDSAAHLLRALGRPRDGVAAAKAADRIVSAVDGLWNPETGSYDWAVHESGFTQTTDWDNLYSDGIANIWAVAYGLVPAKRAAALMATVTQRFPQLLDPTQAGYWPEAAVAYRQVNNRAQAALVLGGITSLVTETDHSWPYTPETAGVCLTDRLSD